MSLMIYLVGPLDTEAEREHNDELAARLRHTGAWVYVPYEMGLVGDVYRYNMQSWEKEEGDTRVCITAKEARAKAAQFVWRKNKAAMERCDMCVANLLRRDCPDTMFKLGILHNSAKHIVGVRPDFELGLALEQTVRWMPNLESLLAEVNTCQKALRA